MMIQTFPHVLLFPNLIMITLGCWKITIKADDIIKRNPSYSNNNKRSPLVSFYGKISKFEKCLIVSWISRIRVRYCVKLNWFRPFLITISSLVRANLWDENAGVHSSDRNTWQNEVAWLHSLLLAITLSLSSLSDKIVVFAALIKIQ